MSTYRVLVIGDIVGRPGRKAVAECLPSLLSTHKPLFTIANAENAAGGVGITADIAEELLRAGCDALTLGNHAFAKKEVYGYLDSGKPVLRPYNMPAAVPGRGFCTVEKSGVCLGLACICGRVFMEGYNDPFAAADEIADKLGGSHLIVDFHAEATSEKVAMGWHLDGRATAVFGTHTHVQTADERVLPGGTAYITDVGMSGPTEGVIGMSRDIILGKFRTSMPARFEVAEGPGVISGITLDVEVDTGRAVAITRFTFRS
jgi:metallophosphoesterase (TIGR00282 family)